MRTFCKNCKLYTETLDGYYYKKCRIYYKPKKEPFNKIIYLSVILAIITFIIMGLNISSAYTANANVSLTNTIGVINPMFYGIGGQDALTSYNNVSNDMDCTLESVSNYTKEWDALLATGVKLIRYDMFLNTHVNSTLDLYDMGRFVELFAKANQSGVKIIFVSSQMSTYLANKTIPEAPCDKNGGISCPPYNYTIYANKIVEFINRSTNNSQYINSIEAIEVFNEPEFSLLTNLTDTLENASIRSKYYNLMYNATYNAVKSAWAGVRVIGPVTSQLSVGGRRIQKTFMGNFTNKTDGISFHNYNYGSASATAFDTSMTIVYTEDCNTYKANCSRIYWDEMNLLADSTSVFTANQSVYFANNYIQGINRFPSVLSLVGFKFSTTYQNKSCDGNYNYSFYWQGNNTMQLPYNITKLFATNHKAGNTVINSSSDRDDLKIVASTDGSKYFITLTNTNSSSASVNLNVPLTNKYLRNVETGEAYYIVNGQTPSITLGAYGVSTFDTQDGNPIQINPFSSNPTNGSTVNSRYVNLGWNVSSVNPINTIIFNWNNTNYTLNDNSLVIHYGFDNLSSLGEDDLNVTELKRGIFNASVIGGNNITWNSSGRYNGNFVWNGNKNAQVRSVATINTAILMNGFTFSAWVKPTQTNNKVSVIYDTFDIYYAYIDSNAQRLTCGVQNETNFISHNSQVTKATGLANEWHYITCVFNGTDIKAYIDGLNYVSTPTHVNGALRSLTGERLYIGNHGSSNVEYFNGSIDEVRLWNKTMSDNDINGQYLTNIQKYNATSYTIVANITDLFYGNYLYNLFVNDSLGNNRLNSDNLNVYLTNAINLGASKGILNSLFYGINTGTTLMNETFYQTASTNMKAKYVRRDALLEYYYSNQTVQTNGVNFTEWSLKIQPQIDTIKKAYENNQRILLIANYMPTWLADNSSGNCTDLRFCPPKNVTIWTNILIDYINRTTEANTTLQNIIDVEVWNEPDNYYMLTQLPADDMNKFNNYSVIYNASYIAIKAFNSNIGVGGVALTFIGNGYTSQNFIKSFLGNYSNKMNFISYHTYEVNSHFNNFNLAIKNQTDTLLSLCATYSANCSRIIVSEWNTNNNTILGKSSYAMQIASGYIGAINNYQTNISMIPYYYAGTDSQAMINTTSHGLNAPYNVTFNYGRYAPSLSSVYSCSETGGADGLCTITKIGSTCSITTANLENQPVNKTIPNLASIGCGSTLIDVSNGQLISNGDSILMNPYDVKYYTTPKLDYIQSYGLNKSNYLNEYIGVGTEFNLSKINSTTSEQFYHFSSSFQANISSILIDYDCSNINGNVYWKPNGENRVIANYTCTNDKLTVYNVKANPSSSSNELIITYSIQREQLKPICASMFESYDTFSGFLGILFAVGVFAFLMSLVGGIIMAVIYMRSGTEINFSPAFLISFILGLVIIGFLVIIFVVFTNSICLA